MPKVHGSTFPERGVFQYKGFSIRGTDHCMTIRYKTQTRVLQESWEQNVPRLNWNLQKNASSQGGHDISLVPHVEHHCYRPNKLNTTWSVSTNILLLVSLFSVNNNTGWVPLTMPSNQIAEIICCGYSCPASESWRCRNGSLQTILSACVCHRVRAR